MVGQFGLRGDLMVGDNKVEICLKLSQKSRWPITSK